MQYVDSYREPQRFYKMRTSSYNKNDLLKELVFEGKGYHITRNACS